MRILSMLLSLIGALGLYPKTAYVCELSPETNTVVVEDANGFLWAFDDGSEDWVIGDGVSMIMYNNETPDWIFDDLIVSTRYNGFSR